LNEIIKIKVIFEIQQIDKLIFQAGPLLAVCKLKDPDFIQMSAMSAVLHSFYNGIESIFLIIEKFEKHSVTKSAGWHKELLNNAVHVMDIISSESRDILVEYMQFRHFFRHAYNFQMSWQKMEHLALGIEDVWKRVKSEVEAYMGPVPK
jgi:hypothetical protein